MRCLSTCLIIKPSSWHSRSDYPDWLFSLVSRSTARNAGIVLQTHVETVHECFLPLLSQINIHSHSSIQYYPISRKVSLNKVRINNIIIAWLFIRRCWPKPVNPQNSFIEEAVLGRAQQAALVFGMDRLVAPLINPRNCRSLWGISWCY
jgi:hypothetical protein